MSTRQNFEYACIQPGLWSIEGRQVRRIFRRVPVDTWSNRTRREVRWVVSFLGEVVAETRTLDAAFTFIGYEAL